MKLKNWIVPLLVVLSLGLGKAGVCGNDSEKSPVAILKARNKAVESILKGTDDNITPATREKLKDVINGIIDFRELSRLALGKYWNERTEQEKKDFVNVFQQLIRNSSVKKLEIYKADRLEYQPAKINGTKAKVTTIAYKGRKQVEITYKMHKVNGRWMVYDMVIDGASTARNYRDSFYKEIAKSSYQAMYEKLVRKLNKEKA
ncbi:MAG: ABC transporter substrate-binding protein [Calditrichaeota bacterium]|nr:MAG: ABC transporter substrate-binding protein [Calditrichota bacterium]